MAKKKDDLKGDFACEEEVIDDMCGIVETIPEGPVLYSFSFEDDAKENENTIGMDMHGNEENIINEESTIVQENNSKDESTINNENQINSPMNSVVISSLYDNRRTPIANGAAPKIDGEAPSVRRCYILRPSTIRKINEIKAKENDLSICVSTIVDMAIDFYYSSFQNS